LQKNIKMLKNSINKYYNTLTRIKQSGGTKNETSIRRAFSELLQDYCGIRKDIILVEEVPYKSTRIRPDGTIRTSMQVNWGFWESKDTKDDLDTEIEKKFAIGYPKTNIIFENSEIAVLIQDNKEVMRIDMKNAQQLDSILTALINFEPQEYKDFTNAINQFKEDVPNIVASLLQTIEKQSTENERYIKTFKEFWEHCKHSINPEIDENDIREMIIQHILTVDIFEKIFGDSQFHRENNIAIQLQQVIETFFTRETKFNLLSSINHYYDLIKSKASQIDDHHEKQKFLKSVYENFYKAYNPKGADKLGIVYTPNEIVKFMIENTDFLLNKHFDKTLADENVEILDPATGTGTYICDLIEYIPEHKLEYKYKNEIHANEVSILPYYIANLNIEYTYQQKMNHYKPFSNLCFVDTLDNMGFGYADKQFSIYSVSTENLERIKNQNSKKISVIIGNPPYNANQQRENENNKNRTYTELDKRIVQTYVLNSKSQKQKVYDMYSRFFRWASDRINGKGIVCYISNNSYIHAKGFDGFRKTIEKEFNTIYVIDLGGDIRAKRQSENKTGNVFNIQVGVCITFLIRNSEINKKSENCEIYYHAVSEDYSAKEKLEYLRDNKFTSINFERIRPDKNGYWMNTEISDFETFTPLISKEKSKKSIFQQFTHGVATNRDEWVYDFDKKNLFDKISFFINEYNSEVERWIQFKKETNYKDIKAESNPVVDNFVHERNIIKWSSRLKRDKLRKEKKGEFIIEEYKDEEDTFHEGNTIKWSKMLKRDKFRKEKKGTFANSDIRTAFYRPFVKKHLYFGYIPIDVKGLQHLIFPEPDTANIMINIASNQQTDIIVLATNQVCDLNFCARGSTCFPLYIFDENGNKWENITEWALNLFKEHYKNNSITKEMIFNYIYAVLHDPKYRQKYETELKREYPKIPFYLNFQKMSEFGKQLIELHTEFDSVEFSKIEIKETDNKDNPKPKLKIDKLLKTITIDDNTEMVNVPSNVFKYQLGNRTAIEWILDQYKEREPSDTTLFKKFNSYKFNDYKNFVLDLLNKICTVSNKTVKLIDKIEAIE